MLVKKRDSEHPVEMAETIYAPVLVSFQNYFGIGMGFETVSFAGQFAFQLQVIVDLPLKISCSFSSRSLIG